VEVCVLLGILGNVVRWCVGEVEVFLEVREQKNNSTFGLLECELINSEVGQTNFVSSVKERFCDSGSLCDDI